MVKNLPASVGDARDMGLIPGSGRSPGGENGNLLLYSCRDDPMGQRSLGYYGPWVAKSRTEHAHTMLIFGWPKSLFAFFSNTLQKTLNEHFGQFNTYEYVCI